MACTDWKKIRNDFRVDGLIGLYIRAAKKTQVYSSPLGEGTVWQGWEIQQGQIMGRVYSWIDGTPANPSYPPLDVRALYIMFEGTAATNWKNYYVKVEKGLIDWPHLQAQLTQQQKSNMNWYEGFTTDVENALCDFSDTVTYYGKIAVGVLLAYAVWDNWLKYEFLLYRAKKTLKSSAKDLKQLLQ